MMIIYSWIASEICEFNMYCWKEERIIIKRKTNTSIISMVFEINLLTRASRHYDVSSHFLRFVHFSLLFREKPWTAWDKNISTLSQCIKNIARKPWPMKPLYLREYSMRSLSFTLANRWPVVIKMESTYFGVYKCNQTNFNMRFSRKVTTMGTACVTR